MNQNYIIRTKNGNKIVSYNEIVENVKNRIEAGEKPHYILNIPRTDKKPGFLVWSTMGGCAVAFPNAAGGYNIVEGWQGDFAYI